MNTEYVRLQQEIKGLGMVRFQNLASASQYFPIYDRVKMHLSPGAKILDWGCGDGHFSYFLLSSGFKVHGLGMEVFGQPDTFKEKFGEDNYAYFQANDPVRLPFQDGQYDAVISMGVLEHVRETGGDEVASLKEICRVLKPGGKFLCFHFPNRRSYIEAIGRKFPSKHHHQYMYDDALIRDLVRQGGMEMRDIGLYGALPRNELARLPAKVRDSKAFVDFYNGLDRVFGVVLRPVVQNYFFVSAKPTGVVHAITAS